MFRRKKPKRTIAALRDMIWPRMGWQRVFSYWHHRVFRGNDSTYKIAAGLAVGAAVSFSPFVGFHIILSIVLARLLRANWIAAALGTAWGNPWTFPFLFTSSYVTGAKMLRATGTGADVTLPEYIDFEYIIGQPKEFFLYLLGHPVELLLPMTLGSLVVGTVFWVFAYCLLYYPVFYARDAYMKRRSFLKGSIGGIRKKKERRS